MLCQDESRRGLHVPGRRRLTGYGVQPVQVVEPLYESSWLYAAVAPTTGDAFWGEVLRLDADCFALFRDTCAQHYAERLHSVLLDHAPAHGAQRVAVPENVLLMWLPAYSPEVNPVERLWEDLTGRMDVLDTWVRSSLRVLQEHGAGIGQRSTAETIASLTGYAYLVEAAYALSF